MNKIQKLRGKICELENENRYLEHRIQNYANENEKLFNELKKIKDLELEYLSKKYNVVILTDGITTRLASDKKEIEKCQHVRFEHEAGSLPKLETTKNIYNEYGEEKCKKIY